MPSPFRSLRHPNYRLYFFGQGVSLIGSWMQTTTLSWLAWEWTKQAKWPAFLLVAQIAPTLFLGSWSGRLADRTSKWALIVKTQCGFLLSALFMTLVVASGSADVWILLILGTIHGVIQAIDMPARLTFVPSLVDREDIPNTVALNSMQFNVARAVGPALAGPLLGAFPPWVCLFCNAVSYLAVLISFCFMRNLRKESYDPAAPKNAMGGWAYLRGYPRIRLVILLAGAVSVCGWPLISLLPAYVETVLHSNKRAFGWLMSSVGGGAVLSALMLASYGNESNRKKYLRAGPLSVAVGLAVLASVHDFGPACLGCALFGFGMILFLATGQSFIQLSVEDANRGKVMGVWAMMVAAGVPAGNLLWGPLADFHGVANVITGQTILMGIIVAVLFLKRA